MSETGRARNWTIPPLRPERECRKRTKFATALLLKILTGGNDVAPSVDETANAAFRNAFVLASDWTTKKVNQSSLRATNGSVAIQSTNATISNGLPRVLRTLAMTNNMRALARHNCHPELDSGSYQRYEREFNVGQMLKRVQHDKMGNIHALARIKALFTYCPIALLPSRAAFTMAEILLSLTIIGVVAAITLPSLTGNINERTWNTQRKALYARFSQALALMPNLNGYGKYSGTNSGGVVTTTEDTAAETFVTDGLSKVLKINNICDNTHLQDCGIVASYTNMVGSMKTWPTKLSELNSMFTSTRTQDNGAGVLINFTNPQKDIDTKAAAFETQNGESIAVYYNPNCITNMHERSGFYPQPKMCANFIYDLNGNKGPNTVGKDIGFITALYSSDPVVVAPMPLKRNASTKNDDGSSTTLMAQTVASKACTDMDPESRLPNRDELNAMFFNRDLIGITSDVLWSGSVVSSDKAWIQRIFASDCFPVSRSVVSYVRCVKR